MVRACAACFLVSTLSWGAQQHSATGMVMKVDPPHKTFIVSCQSIPGFMEAMSMPFTVHDAKELNGISPGQIVEFTLTVDEGPSYAEHIRVKPYQSAEQDPFTARRLELLNRISNGSKNTTKALSTGEQVPDFTLIDTQHRSVSLSQFSGKVVALNFIYTSC